MDRKDRIDYEKGIVHTGNQARIKEVMTRAEMGEKITIGFIGGSITQGSLATKPELCYAAHVFDWWKQTFPKSEFIYINAGIGGTTSHFGTARVELDLLTYKPDVIIVEFSVNDDSTDFFLETYEGLIRKILKSPSEPAVMLVHNVRYDTGGNAQIQHAKIGRYYDIPSVSMQSTIYDEIVRGNINNREITEDDLHPNDRGHRLVADVIKYFLMKIFNDREIKEEKLKELPKALTPNCYENLQRYQNNASPICKGFIKDNQPKNGITDIFKNGWTASAVYDSIMFQFYGTEAAVQYRKSVNRPVPIAIAIIDGDEDNAIILDANFDEDWGDCLFLQPVLIHGNNDTHMVEIRIIEAHEKMAAPFYLVSVIAG